MDFRTNPPAAARQKFSKVLYIVALYSKYNRALTFSEFLSGNNIMEKAPKLEVPSRLGRKGAGYACMQVCVQEGAVFMGPRVCGFERVEGGAGGEGV
jgi:hypothetical protein